MRHVASSDIVQAEQWSPGKRVWGVCYCLFSSASAHIHLSLGAIVLKDADWVVMRSDGSLFVVEPQVFTSMFIPFKE